MGDYCNKFEIGFSRWQGCNYSTLVNSGASANLVLLQSLKNIKLLNDGDKIAFSAVTWATNVMPIIQLNMIPVPIDISIWNLNLDIDIFKNFIKKEKITCLFVTNALGFCCDLKELAGLCKENNIILIEDDCESLGTEYKGKKIGNYGIASTFSFYIAHQLSTIEGGMICTDSELLYDELKMVRANGWDRNLDIFKQNKLRNMYHINDFYSKFTFYDLGMNVRPTEIIGFLGYSQLQYLDKIVLNRYKNFISIYEAIKNNDELLKIDWLGYDKLSNFSIPIICKTKEIKEKYLNIFKENGIETRPLIAGNIARQPFFNKYMKKEYDLKNADFIHDNAFYCPNYPEMTKKEIERIKYCLKKVPF